MRSDNIKQHLLACKGQKSNRSAEARQAAIIDNESQSGFGADSQDDPVHEQSILHSEKDVGKKRPAEQRPEDLRREVDPLAVPTVTKQAEEKRKGQVADHNAEIVGAFDTWEKFIEKRDAVMMNIVTSEKIENKEWQ